MRPTAEHLFIFTAQMRKWIQPNHRRYDRTVEETTLNDTERYDRSFTVYAQRRWNSAERRENDSSQRSRRSV